MSDHQDPEFDPRDESDEDRPDSKSGMTPESSADELPTFRSDSELTGDVGAATDPLLGQRLGPYKILQVLGHGGMGTVYVADQERPMRRRVALKVIKEKRQSEQVLRRFEAERQALAMMSHENIAKVLDAGEDENRPYFVMELVRGIPITQYCDTNRLSVEDRLKLFIPVCKAVHHAHQKAIIHRDLKPTNILVEEVDGQPVPKVIDFGLAKALNTQAKLTDETFFTEFGRVVGTVHYMSPEQAEMNQLDVDTRTDIYSLGVVLYELLTGTRPLDDETIRKNAFLKILELIREQEPDKPSSRISDSKNSAVDFGKQRRVTRTRLEQILRGDLDWIVMKSLEKDRVRRYASANDFGEDIQNYLDDNVVTARPPTLAYRAAKFVRKHLAAVASSLIILLVIVVALIVISVQAYRLKDAVAQEQQQAQKLQVTNEQLKTERQKLQVTNEQLETERQKLQVTNEQLASEKQKSDTLATDLKRAGSQLLQWLLEFKVPILDRAKLDRIESLSLLAANNLPGVSIPTIKEAEGQLVVKRQSSRRLWQGKLTVSSSGRWLATADRLTGNIRVWDTDSKILVNSWKAHEQPEDRGGFWPTVSGILFDPNDDNVLYSTGLDGTIAKWDRLSGEQLVRFVLPKQQATALAWDRSGPVPTLVVGTNQGALIRFDSRELTELARSQPANERINGIAVSGQGRIASVGAAGSCFVLDAEGQNPRAVSLPPVDLLCVAFSPNGQQLAVGGADGRVVVHQADTLELVKTIEAHQKGPDAEDDLRKVRTLFWAGDGRLYSGGSDGEIKRWSANFELEQSFAGHQPNVYGRSDVMDLAVTDTECYSIGRDHSTRVWSLDSATCTHALQGSLFPHVGYHTSDYARFAYHSASGELLVASDSKDAYARLWNLDDFREIHNYSQFPIDRYIEENDGPLTQDIAWSNDGKRFAVAEPTGQISIWDRDGQQPSHVLKAHELQITGNPRRQYLRVAWSSDDRELISLGNDHQLKVWSMSDFQLLRESELVDKTAEYLAQAALDHLPATSREEAERSLKRLYFDDQLLLRNDQWITAGRDRMVRIWDASSGQLKQKYDVGSPVTSLTMSSDQSLVAVGSEDGTVTMIDLEKNRIASRRSHDFQGLEQVTYATGATTNSPNWFGNKQYSEWNLSVRGLAFSPNNRLLAVSSGNGVLTLMTTSGEILYRAFNYEQYDQSWRQQLPFFTADGRLFTVGADQAIREWELEVAESASLGQPEAEITNLIVDPASGRIIQIGLPEKADDFVWEKSGANWVAIQLPDDWKDITQAAFIPQSRDLLLGTLDGRAVRYDYLNRQVKLEFNGEQGDRKHENPIGVFRDGARVACSYSGGLAASTWSSGGRHTIDIWDLETGQWKSTLEAHRGVEALAFHPKLKYLAVTNEGGSLVMWDLEQESIPNKIFEKQGPQFARGLQFFNEGKLVVQAGEFFNNRLLAFWDARGGDEIDPVGGEPVPSDRITELGNVLIEADPVVGGMGEDKIAYRDVAVSPDGKWMVTAGLDGYLVLWKIEGMKVTLQYKVPTVSLGALIGNMDEAAASNPSLEHIAVENVEFGGDSQTVYFSGKQGPIRTIKLEDVLGLADRSPSEKLADYQKRIGLKLDVEGRAVNIERNQLDPVDPQ